MKKIAKTIHTIKKFQRHPLTKNAFLAAMCFGPWGSTDHVVPRHNETGLLFKYLNSLLCPLAVTGHVVLLMIVLKAVLASDFIVRQE